MALTFRSLGRALTGAVGGFIGGGPVGAIAGAIGGYRGPQHAPGHAVAAPSQPWYGTHPGAGVPAPTLPNIIGAVTGAVGAFGARGPDFAGVIGGSSTTAPGMTGRPAGYHINRTGYYLKGGQYVPPRSRWVRNRTTNYGNGRAARKAGRRLKGTVKLLRRSFRFVEARPPKGKAIVRGRGR